MKNSKPIIVAILLLVAIPGFSQNTIQGYEYWFDNNYSERVSQAVSPESDFTLDASIQTTGLISGVHTFNFRTWDNEGVYSVLSSSFFYKIPQTSHADVKIVAYEYWFDNDYADKTRKEVASQTNFNLNELLDTEDLIAGIHTVNIRFKDNSGLWSSTINQFFYKLIIPEEEVVNNSITAYCYWFDSDFKNVVYVQLAKPVKNFNLVENIDLTPVPKGEHEINFQFRDTLGMWSSVLTDKVEKMALPVAGFSYEMNTTCENTVVTFTDRSVDNDTRSWNFGNGETSGEISPVCTYNTPGEYSVSLTVSDTETGKESTKRLLLSIPDPNTYSSITETACGSYTAPDGQVYTESNQNITAIIPNAAGCDSIITIALTVHAIDVSVVADGNTLSATAFPASYQWLDCGNGNVEIQGETGQSFTPTVSGSYAVRITQNDCVDTSTCHEVIITSIGKVEGANRAAIYPNPTTGVLNVDLGEARERITIVVNDVFGKTVRKMVAENQRYIKLHLDEVPGIYLVSIETEFEKSVCKVIKE